MQDKSALDGMSLVPLGGDGITPKAVCDRLTARQNAFSNETVEVIYDDLVADFVGTLCHREEDGCLSWAESLYDFARCTVVVAALDSGDAFDALSCLVDYVAKVIYELAWRAYEARAPRPTTEEVSDACRVIDKGFAVV